MKKDSFAVQIGQNILNLRKRACMTQAQLAEKINVSTTFISRVERGEKFVSLKILQSLAEVFSVSYDALLRDAGTNSSLQNIQMMLAGRSAEHVAWVEEILRVCERRPTD